MILLLDSFDSFTYNLLDYFGQLGVTTQVLRNNVSLAHIQQQEFEAIVLSPGPGKPREAGVLMQVIEYYHAKLPMLGICLGHQALGEFFGATLVKGSKPMHGKVSEITCMPDPLFAGLPRTMPVVRYHSLVLQEPGAHMVPLAYTAARELMAFRHQTLPLYALQFHPEAALTSYGLDILRNWVTIANIQHRLKG